VYEVQSEGNVIVYNNVCMEYRVKDLLLRTLM